ncbi:ABC transporter substrate-binding protein [Paenibacillus mesophilus]|uniref:ABC transporter substrate-binding protein n=1 Tax=Paenibacillus mesophilus TaxID=2582849 RepID=UPI0013053FDB|nr:extracellular solute-binding protein [Paenibacillus mesophilus]
MKKCGYLAISLMVVSVLAGCNRAGGTPETSGEGGGAASTIPAKPVTITAAIEGISVDDQLRSLITDHLQRKHPNITFQLFNPVAGTTLNDLITSGQTPDIIFTFNGNLLSYRNRDLLYDMTSLMKTHGVDLSRFEPNIIRDVIIASTRDELYALPFSLNFHALYYNKDIFDKFGASYPTDGMNWDQTVELAKKATRLDGGTQYRGLDTGNGVIWIAQPLSAAAVNPVTEIASMNTEVWKKVFTLVKSIYAIPGNEPKGSTDAFLKTKNLAMLLGLNMLSSMEKPTAEGMNWDVAQYPSYPERPNIYGNASVLVMAVTKSSKNKDQAMQVIQTVTSDELQLESSRQGRLSSLHSPEIQQAFGMSMTFLKDKHLQSIFKSKPVQYPVSSQYRSKAEAIVHSKFNQYLQDQVDVNTALLQADEEINKMIEAEKGK